MDQVETPQREEFRFTREQLSNLLTGAVEASLEYRDEYGYEESEAGPAAVGEIIGGLDAEANLAESGKYKATMQTSPRLPMTRSIGIPSPTLTMEKRTGCGGCR